jgi:hypothetical protein
VNASSFGGLHSAEAAKAQALASVDAELANLDAAQHKLQQDEALYARAERDRVRYQALVIKEEISRSYYDARETEAAAAAQIQSPQQLVSFSSSEKPARKLPYSTNLPPKIEMYRVPAKYFLDSTKPHSCQPELQNALSNSAILRVELPPRQRFRQRPL